MSQRGGGYPVHGNIQDQAGQGSEQPDPVDAPAHCNGLWLDDLQEVTYNTNYYMIIFIQQKYNFWTFVIFGCGVFSTSLCRRI